jgi:hypothetical protein
MVKSMSCEEPTAEQLETLLRELPNQSRHHRLTITLILVPDAWIGAAGDLLPAELDEGFKFEGDERSPCVLRKIVPGNHTVSTTFSLH